MTKERQRTPLLAVVPARGGSVTLPGKNLRVLNGKPLILWILEAAKQTPGIDRIIVSTEDREIASFCRLRGYEVADRPENLSENGVPIIDVVSDLVISYDWIGDIVVCQPTCPIISSLTIGKFIRDFRDSGLDWAIAGSRFDHIVWQDGYPLVPRVNRQLIKDFYKETGMQIMNSQFLWNQESKKLGILPIPEDEALDIDNGLDFMMVEKQMARKNIEFYVGCDHGLGTGHFWRALQLTEALPHHNVVWSDWGQFPEWALRILDAKGILRGIYGDLNPDLFIHDALEPDPAYILDLRSRGIKVVLFESEDRFADLTVNELLPSNGRLMELSGPAYAVLRPEFRALPPYKVKDKVRRVLLTFGGSDSAELARRVGQLFVGVPGEGLEIRIIQGPYAQEPKLIPGIHGNISVVTKPNMAEEMFHADLCITSQGRTQYETAICGVPTITIAANERESRHVKCSGQIHLGLHAKLGTPQLVETIDNVMQSKKLREEMSLTAGKVVDGKGLQRIVHHIDSLLGEL